MRLVDCVTNDDAGAKAVLSRIDEIYDDIEDNVTRIWGRRDVMLGIDLTYHSALQFVWGRQLVTRGWVEVLIPGDAGTGKSTIAERMLAHYQAGELRTGETVSLAGLIGGIDRIGDRTILKWGILPRCDGKILIIDEAHSMPAEVLGALTGIRSSGIAEITKIHMMRARARVRLVWIVNPIGYHNDILSYGCGVRVIQSVVPRSEDQRRFDLMVIAASTDIDNDYYEKEMRRTPCEHRFVSRLCNKLVRWIWSRKPNQIQFEPAAEVLITEIGHSLSASYDREIPLMIYQEGPLKIARLSAAIAARVFSYTSGGSDLIVRAEHARAIEHYLKYIYNKPSCSYDRWTETRRMKIDVVRERLRFLGKAILGAIHRQENLSKNMLADIILNKEEASEFYRFLLMNNCIQVRKRITKKTSPFVDLLNQLLVDPATPNGYTSPKKGDGYDSFQDGSAG